MFSRLSPFSPVGFSSWYTAGGTWIFSEMISNQATVGFIRRELITGYVPKESFSGKECWEKNRKSRTEQGP